MKLKYEFMIRQVAGENVLIPMGKSALSFSGMVTANDVGAFICEKLQRDTTREELLEAVCDTFEVDRDTAEKDLDEYLQLLRKARLLEE